MKRPKPDKKTEKDIRDMEEAAWREWQRPPVKRPPKKAK